MPRENITQLQGNCILIMFIFGSTIVFGVGSEAGQDMWIAFVLALAMTVPAVLVYARIMSLSPGKDLFEIMEELFGKIFGKTLTVLVAWFAIHLGASVLRNFTDFIQVVSMPETPQLPVAILILAVIIYLTKCGVELFGRWAAVTLIIICAVFLFTLSLSFKSMEFTNILPIMGHSSDVIIRAAFQQFSLPLAETVLFLGLAGSLKKEASPYKAYLYAILFAGTLTIIIILRNISLLGPLMEAVYYPSYVATRLVNTGDFLVRTENLISINYLFAGVVKLSLCVFAGAKGLASLFNIQNYKDVLAPVCLLLLMFSVISYESVMHLFDFVKNYYPIYVFPFQVIIPLLVWIAAEIRRVRKDGAGNTSK